MNLFSSLKATFLGQPDFPWENRRQHQRLRLSLPIESRQGLRHARGQVLDLSAAGLRISSPLPARSGDTLSLWPAAEVSLVGRQRVACRTAWCRASGGQYQIGLHWSDPDSWIHDLWRRIQPKWAYRRHLRVLCLLDIQVSSEEDAQSWQAVCHDLSPGGCRIRLQAHHLNLDQVVRLDFTSLKLDGRVVGRAGNYYHLRFTGPPCPRLRGLLLNLVETQASICEDPAMEENLLPPSRCPIETIPEAPKSLASVAVPHLPGLPNRSGLPDGPRALHRRQLLPDRNPSLWAARNLPLRKCLNLLET